MLESAGPSPVVHPCDAEHGVVDSVAFEAAVAQDLPGVHAGRDVLDAGADLLVALFVGLLPVGQLLALAASMRHHEPGAPDSRLEGHGRGTLDCGSAAQPSEYHAWVAAAGAYGSCRIFWRFGRFSTGIKPRRTFSSCSSFMFSRTARWPRIRCCVSGVQNTSRRSRARVIAV